MADDVRRKKIDRRSAIVIVEESARGSSRTSLADTENIFVDIPWKRYLWKPPNSRISREFRRFESADREKGTAGRETNSKRSRRKKFRQQDGGRILVGHALLFSQKPIV